MSNISLPAVVPQQGSTITRPPASMPSGAALSAASAVPQAPENSSSKALDQASASQAELQRVGAQLASRVAALAPELQYSVDQSSGQVIMKFTDRKTNEIIRQFPSQEVLHMAEEMDRFQRGLLLNRKA